MIQIDEVLLPIGKGKGFKKPEGVGSSRWQTMKPDMWRRAYMHCLYSLPLYFGLPLHSVVPRMAKKMMEASDPMNVALRFLGEAELAGYITFDKGIDQRVVMPTKKYLDLDLEHSKVPDEYINYPRLSGEALPKVPVRGGINNRTNSQVAKVALDIGDELFEVNKYMLKFLRKYPPKFEKPKHSYMYQRALVAADELLGKQFRFPYFMCSRGRIYTDTTCGLTPQGSDHEKAVILPAYKETLTVSGYESLLETAKGYSEMDWSVEEMLSHVVDPEENQGWREADKPYSYMASAQLLFSYHLDPEQPLPAFRPRDGRCSGLQHWSAVVKSNAITKHLGMHEEEDPQDIYEKVASDWEDSLPDNLKHLATRKAAKVPVMTWGYNATIMTSIEHLDKLFGAKSAWNVDTSSFELVGDGMTRKEVSGLGVALYSKIQDTLSPLQAAVDWVSNCAVEIAKAGNIEIQWVTPDGFTCLQRKVKGVRLQVSCTLSDDSEFSVEVLDFSGEVPNTRKHKSAIAPNIIHSLDATHLRAVAIRLKELGLPKVFIHDSFATHCNHQEALYSAIVDTFIDLYTQPYLLDLKTYWERFYGVELTDPPEPGDWEPESLRNLHNFFL